VAKVAKAGRQLGNGKKEALRQTVLKVAAELFAERGYAGTSLQDLADELGMSRPSLYYYFSSKEAILASLVEEVTVFSHRQSERVAANPEADPDESLRLLVRNHAKWLLEHSVQFRVVDRSESELPEETREVHNAAKRALLEDFTRLIAHGIQVGHFRGVDPRVAAFAMLGMCSWTAWWFKPDGRQTADAIADMIADMALHSVRREGAKRSKIAEVGDAFQMLRDDISRLELLLKH
jgi:AcrR family transcriptional regulator